jgi:mRNA interferase MazF
VPHGYVPDFGDFMCLNFASALVVSPATYNDKTCPLTTQIKNHPFEVKLAGNPASVVLADQVKSVDGRARKAVRKGKAAPAELAEVRAKIRALIG